ncbi:MAG: DNA-3-methyladenine glycosylase 2 family protein [Gemmatimonadales bacterium]
MPLQIPHPRQLTRESLRAGTRVLCARDPDLARIVDRLGPPPLWGRRPGYPTLVRIILEQQVSLAAARTMYARLRHAAGPVTPGSVAQLGVLGLRQLGFTGQKASYCVELAATVLRGELDLGAVARATGEQGRQRLLQVRGLGPWSVDIYFLMALRRPDVWPHGDLALMDAVCRVKGMRPRPDHATLTRFAERWAPWRAVAARILWSQYLALRAIPAGPARASRDSTRKPASSARRSGEQRRGG